MKCKNLFVPRTEGNNLTLTMPNFINGKNPPSIFGTTCITFRDMKTQSWSANSIEPGQTARMCRLAWLYTGGKG